ncbi:MAG: alpha/beta fold hydrolase [archaeon]
MMEKLILVHGWGGSPDGESWFGPLKKECEISGIKFIAPAMPDSDNPKMGEWVSKLKEVIGDLDENTCFVGHSIGCQTIIRYLSDVGGNIKVGGIVFVAPWTKLNEKSIEEEGEESVEIVKSWVGVPMDFEKARNHMTKVLAIFSDDDPYVPLSETKIFKKKLNSKIIVKSGEGHFNETEEIKDIMEFLKDDDTDD